MFLFAKANLSISKLKKHSPQTYYFLWLFGAFFILYLLNSSIYGFLFFGILVSFLVLKLSPKIAIILALILLGLCSIFLTLKDKYLAELLATYAYLFLGVTLALYLKLFWQKQNQKKDNRILLKELKGINVKKLVIFLLIFLSLLLFQRILLTSGNIEIGDAIFPLEQKRIIEGANTLWENYGSFAGQTKTNLFLFYALMQHLLYLPRGLIVKFMILEVVIVNIFSVYFLTKKIFKNFVPKKNRLELLALLLPILYLFNPYSLNCIFHFFHWVGYLFLPLILLTFIKLLETDKIRYAAFLAFLLSFITFSPHYLLYALIMLGLFGIIEITNLLWKKKIKKPISLTILKKTANIFILILCFLFFSAHWLIPYIKTNLLENSLPQPNYMLTKEYIEQPKEIFKPLSETLSLKAQATESRGLNFFSKIFIFTLPFILFMPLHPSFRNKRTIFFSILGLLVAIISTMPIWHYTLYHKFLFDIPYLKNFGWLFRESSRINGLLAFSYTFLLGFLSLRLLRIRFTQMRIFLIIIGSLFLFWAGAAWYILKRFIL